MVYIDAVSDDEYDSIISQSEIHYKNLKKIVEGMNITTPEGGCYYHHGTFGIDMSKDKLRKNLATLSKRSNNIIEIGFNMGHSVVLMLVANPQCKIYCYDICEHPYVEKCAEYVCSAFPDRVFFVKGDSKTSLYTYNGPTPDLIHIDGKKEADMLEIDYINSSCISKPNHTIIVFNGSKIDHVKRYFKYNEISNRISKVNILPTEDHLIGLFMKRNKKPIALCTLSIGEDYKRLVMYSNKVKQDYCKSHIYDYRDDEDDEIVDKSRPLAWSKVNLIRRCLKDGYDYVVWIDADAFIMNPTIKLESIIVNFSKDKDILLTMDAVDVLNSGVMFIKNTEWSKAFFDLVYNMTDFINHSNWEQGAIIDLYENNILDSQYHIAVLPKTYQRLFNSYCPLYKDGDFILHLAGCWRDNTDKGLCFMMNHHCPVRMEHETDETYNIRMERLKTMNM